MSRRTSARRALVAVLSLAGTLAPTLAAACPVCFAAEQRRVGAYVGTTVLLSLLPLILIGGIALLIVRRLPAAAATTGDTAAPRPATSPAVTPPASPR